MAVLDAHRPLSRLAVASLALVFCTIWSSAFVATKFGLEVASPLWLASARFFLASVIMLGIARCLGHSLALRKRDALLIGAIGLLNNSLYLGLTFTALQTVSAGLVSVLASTTPLLTTCAAAVWLGDRPRSTHLIGLLLGGLGTLFVLHHRLVGGTDGVAGILLALGGIMALVTGTIFFKRLRSPHSLLVVNGYQLLAGGLALAPLAWREAPRHPATFGLELIASLVYLSVVVSIGASLIWFYLLRRGSARAVSAYHFLNPVIGLLLSAWILHEPIVASDLVGLLPIIAGIVLVSWVPTRTAADTTAFGAGLPALAKGAL